jgi:hypothetical protein
MKKKIVGIFVCMLLMAAAVLPVVKTMKINSEIKDSDNEVTDIRERIPKLILFPRIPRISNRDWNFWSNKPNIFLIRSGNVGVGTKQPSEKLDVVGTVQMTGFKMPTGANDGFILTSDASGNGTWQASSGGISGTGANNFIPKFTDTTSIGDSAIYEENGNVSIGNTTPQGILHISHNHPHDGTPALILDNTHSHGRAWIKFKVGNEDEGYIYFNKHGAAVFNAKNDIHFRSMEDTKMLIQATGNVGIGTTNPENTLHVNGAINLDPVTEPSNPVTGFVLYCDSADGILKAKSSAGTITVLANP